MAEIAIVLAFLGTLITNHFHDTQATRDRMLQDAERQCFEVDASQRNCSVLNDVTRTNLLEGQPLPVDLSRDLKGAVYLEPSIAPEPKEPTDVQAK
ncbi:MAG TPA: hypothetical protein VN081_03875 [Dongiaceae bacterium]|nr:hypothetical protein [Dongiaceae bacterium]